MIGAEMVDETGKPEAKKHGWDGRDVDKTAGLAPESQAWQSDGVQHALGWPIIHRN
jgi:hypothetical protein